MASASDESVWLWEAPERFGPKKLVAASRAENDVRRVAPPDKIPDSLSERLALASDMFKQIFPPKPATQELRAQVADLIHRGELEAYGIQIAPTPSAEPELIPRHMFSDPDRINWNNSIIKRSGRHYEEIRVRRAQTKPPVETRQKTIPLKNGRPSKSSEIDRLIEEITREGVDLNALPRKDACDHIRRAAERKGLNTAIGYSEPVLKRALTIKFGPRR